MLAIALVSCDVDSQIASVASLPERPGKNTPDFEAVLVNGGMVRIEVTQFADALLRAYIGNLNSIFTPVQEEGRAAAEICSRIRGGCMSSSQFPRGAPHGRERQKAGKEIMSILRRIDP